MLRSISLTICLCIVQLISAQNMNIAQKLGYAKQAKLLIIHADDLGVSHSENQASIKALESGPVNSASIMAPCPWFPEIAAYAKEHQEIDFGLHLTLNSEWDFYKWGPVSSLDSVRTLVNGHGYFYASVDSVVQNTSPDEAYIEMRNQIRKAHHIGIELTHLDAHMGAAVANPEFLSRYLLLGKEYQLPVLLDSRVHQIEHPEVKALIDHQTVVADRIMSASPDDYEGGMNTYYSELLKGLDSGLNVLLIHLAYNDKEMQAITVNHPYWGAAWRQADTDFFSSDECRKILEQEDIILVSWREIRDRILRN